MMTLNKILEQDARVMRDATLPVEAYRAVLKGAVKTFHEASIRQAFPVEITGYGPGAIQSRAIKLVDVGTAQHSMKGTGGTWDKADYAMDDQPFYPIFQNVEVPMREQEASSFGDVGLNLFRDSGVSAGLQVVEQENNMLLNGLGPVTGLQAASGIQTLAGASWTTQGQAYKDVVKARAKLRNVKAPMNNVALLVNPAEEANLLQTFSNTSVAQLDQLMKLLPGGIYTNTNVTAGSPVLYAKDETVLRVRVGQDLTVVPLPKIDEDDRMRVRTISTTHFLRPTGICQITGVT